MNSQNPQDKSSLRFIEVLNIVGSLCSIIALLMVVTGQAQFWMILSFTIGLAGAACALAQLIVWENTQIRRARGFFLRGFLWIVVLLVDVFVCFVLFALLYMAVTTLYYMVHSFYYESRYL